MRGRWGSAADGRIAQHPPFPRAARPDIRRLSGAGSTARRAAGPGRRPDPAPRVFPLGGCGRWERLPVAAGFGGLPDDLQVVGAGEGDVAVVRQNPRLVAADGEISGGGGGYRAAGVPDVLPALGVGVERGAHGKDADPRRDGGRRRVVGSTSDLMGSAPAPRYQNVRVHWMLAAPVAERPFDDTGSLRRVDADGASVRPLEGSCTYRVGQRAAGGVCVLRPVN